MLGDTLVNDTGALSRNLEYKTYNESIVSISLESSENDCENESDHNVASKENHFKSYDTIHSINQWPSMAVKKPYTLAESQSLVSELKSQGSQSQRSEETHELEESKKICRTLTLTSESTVTLTRSALCIFVFILSISVVIICIGINLILIGTIHQHGKYNKIESIEYMVTEISTKYCSNYDECYWSCCFPPFKNYYCPKINEYIDNLSYCKRTTYTDNIGKRCGLTDVNGTTTKTYTRREFVQCCQGGPCLDEKNYWKTKCIYKLVGDDITYVNVSLNHLFFDKITATNSFQCMDTMNSPVYFPTIGYEFLITPSNDFLNCSYESSKCKFMTDKIFDRNQVYSTDSMIFYNQHIDTLRKYIIGGILLMLGGIIICIGICFKFRNSIMCSKCHVCPKLYKTVPIVRNNIKR